MVLPGGIAGVRGIRWDIYVEVAGRRVLDMVGVVVWLVVSFVARKDTPKTMGWRADNLWRATKRAALFFCI